jgi:hypothetical protein
MDADRLADPRNQDWEKRYVTDVPELSGTVSEVAPTARPCSPDAFYIGSDIQGTRTRRESDNHLKAQRGNYYDTDWSTRITGSLLGDIFHSVKDN